MRKLIFFTLILAAYNFSLLILPVVFFLSILSFSRNALLNTFPWVYGVFVFFSPVLTIILGYRIAQKRQNRLVWFIPIFISFFGFLPLLFFYTLLNSVWNLMDLLVLLVFPVSLGLFADLAVWVRNCYW